MNTDGMPLRQGRCAIKKIAIALIGGTVVLLGIGMIVLPGPALLIIPAGLAILASEFIWAKRALRRCKRYAAKARKRSGLRDWLRRRRPRACQTS